MKKTKIICSMGPSCLSYKVFKQMANEGMDVVRINLSHATKKEIRQILVNLVRLNNEMDLHLGLLFDTKGPELRIEDIPDEGIKLIEGDTLRISKKNLNHPEVLDKLSIGNIIEIENDLMKIEVIRKYPNYVKCKVLNGGILYNKKSLYIPNVKLDIPFLSKEDINDIKYACKMSADFLALSFVSCKEDVLSVKKIINSDIKIIAKIENAEGIKNIQEILEVADGIMVARGDLGEDIPVSLIPYNQKKIIKLAREQNKIAIVATEMLESMKENIRPTRAEVSDIANCVLDGADALLLSGETTTGLHPVESVKFMAKIAEDTEKYAVTHFDYTKRQNISDSIAKSAVSLAENIKVSAIVSEALTGYSTSMISNFRPNCPILACCTTAKVARSLSLNYGVFCRVVPLVNDTDTLIEIVKKEAIDYFKLKSKDKIIITGGSPQLKITNFLKIEEIS